MDEIPEKSELDESQVESVHATPDKNDETKETTENSQSADISQSILSKLQELEDLFRRKIKVSESEKIINDKLHKELRDFKDGTVDMAVIRVLSSVADIYNSITRTIQTATDKGETTIPLDDVEFHHVELLAFLENNDVELLASQDGDVFDRRIHDETKSARVITSDMTKDKKVKPLSHGYSHKKLTAPLLRETVAVYEYRGESEHE